MKVDENGNPMNFWWQAEPDRVYGAVFQQVHAIEQMQSQVYQRFLRLAQLYDPHERMGLGSSGGPTPESFTSDNVVQSSIDTGASIIAKSQPRLVVQTDGGNWKDQRQAKLIERYLNGILEAAKVNRKRQEVFIDAAIFGTGVLKVYPKIGSRTEFAIDRIVPDDIIVDERECIYDSHPKNLHQRRFVDKDALAAEFPAFEKEIHASSANTDYFSDGFWSYYRQLEHNQTVVIESWHRPRTGEDGEILPGRHTICIANAVLHDEEWEHDWFPFVVLKISDRRRGFYGRGWAEELAGRQRVIHRMNWQYDQWIQRNVFPFWAVHVADAQMAVKAIKQAGMFMFYRNAEPKLYAPNAIPSDFKERLAQLKAEALSDIGISSFSAHSEKPAGLESGVALREVTDNESERFAIAQQRQDHTLVECGELIIAWCKDVLSKGQRPKVEFRGKNLNNEIEWSEVSVNESPYTISIDVASSLARTNAGRKQTVIEYSQAGLITQDEARKLLDHPDLEAVTQPYTIAIETVQRIIERIEDGEQVQPEAYDPLELAMWLVQRAYITDRDNGAPEEVLEGFRQYMDTASTMLGDAQPPQPAMPAMPMGQPGAQPMGVGPAGMAPAPMAPPGAGPAQSAFAPQAMNLVAGAR